MMKTQALITLLFLSVAPIFAQKISVSEREQSIEKVSRTGLSVVLELDKKEVKDLWKKQLKEYGKVESNGNIMSVNSAKMPTVSSGAVNVVSMVQSSSGGTLVWIGVDMGAAWVKSGGKGYSALEKILRDFGVSAYTSDINAQIEDANKALEKATKSYEKTVKEGDNLKSELDRNAERKLQLEQQLRDNADDKVRIEEEIEANKGDQETAQGEVDQMKKAVDIVTDKLDGIE